MTSLFDPLKVGAWQLPNRVVMAPLTRNRAPGQIANAMMARYYAQRASAGLLITEATPVCAEGQGYADVPGLYTPEQARAWRQVTDAVHAAGGRIVVQLWHVGRVSHTLLQPGGAAPVAPSALTANTKTYLIENGAGRFAPTSPPRALLAQEIPGVIDAFAQAARQAVEVSGFDGVEIHGANGYLLDQFLKNGANHRSDEWGGSIENRARLMLGVVRAVCQAIGGDRTGLRLSPVTPANDIVDADPQPLFEHLMRHLGPLGLAYLHLIEGSTSGPRDIADRPFDYAALQRAWREAGAQGAWMVNNGYDSALAQSAVDGGADLVAWGKAFISNPDLVERLRQGAALNAWDRATFYGGGDQGYTDYPRLA